MNSYIKQTGQFLLSFAKVLFGFLCFSWSVTDTGFLTLFVVVLVAFLVSTFDRKLIIVCGLCLFILFIVYVWPTQYRYDKLHLGADDPDRVIRIDRFSGDIEYWSGSKWR